MVYTSHCELADGLGGIGVTTLDEVGSKSTWGNTDLAIAILLNISMIAPCKQQEYAMPKRLALAQG